MPPKGRQKASSNDNEILSILKDINNRLQVIERIIQQPLNVLTCEYIETHAKSVSKRTLHPTNEHIEKITSSIQSDGHFQVERSVIRKRVRNWFRKQREYMSYRINSKCKASMSMGREEFIEMYKKVMDSDTDCLQFAKECKIEVEQKDQAIEMVREKMNAFYKKHL